MKRLVYTVQGRRFEIDEGESLLDAAGRAGIVFAYSCRTGRCGTCKAKLLAGRTHATHDESGLTKSESNGGWVLTCVRSVESDVELDIEDLGDLPVFAVKTVPCRIQVVELVTPDVTRVVLRLPPTVKFNFYAGQYITVSNKNGVARSYSIANAPIEGMQLEIFISRVSGGQMSRYWFDEAQVHDLLRLHGPQGTFFLREVADLDLVFLATGTGIAPVKAMIEHLSRNLQSRPRSIRVIWGVRSERDLFWNGAEGALNFEFIPVLSRAAQDWDGIRGYVQDAFFDLSPQIDRTAVYACGSTFMIVDAHSRLMNAGLNPRRFYSDAFVSSSPT